MCFFKKLILPIVVGFMCMSFSLQAQAPLLPCDQGFVLVAGGQELIPVGTVTLTFSNEEPNGDVISADGAPTANGVLTVVIDTSGTGWVLGITHVDAGDQFNIFPVNKNYLPKVGKFTSTVDGNKIVTVVTHELTGIGTNTDGTMVVAVHANVFKIDDLTEDIIQEESAWAAGTFFNDTKNWSQYITCELPPPPTTECPKLCKDTIDSGIALAQILLIPEEPVLSFFGCEPTGDGNGQSMVVAYVTTDGTPDTTSDATSASDAPPGSGSGFTQLGFVLVSEPPDQQCSGDIITDHPGPNSVLFPIPPATSIPSLPFTTEEMNACIDYTLQQVNATFGTNVECGGDI